MNENLIKFLDSVVESNAESAKEQFSAYIKEKTKTLVSEGIVDKISEEYFNNLNNQLLEFTEDSRIKLLGNGKVLVDGKHVGHVKKEESLDYNENAPGIIFVTLDGKEVDVGNTVKALYDFIADRFLKNGLK